MQLNRNPYIKLKDRLYSIGETSIDLSRQFTILTGDVDLTKLLHQIKEKLYHAYLVVKADNMLSGRTRIESIAIDVVSDGNREYAINQLGIIFEFVSKVIGRKLKFNKSVPSIATQIELEDGEIIRLSTASLDIQYLVRWIANIYSSFINDEDNSSFNCTDIFLVPFPETFLSVSQQSRLMPELAKLLPNARFIFATQSPTILSSISPIKKDYYIYLMQSDKNGSIYASELQNEDKCVYGANMDEIYNLFWNTKRAVPYVDELILILQDNIKAKNFDEADKTILKLKTLISYSDKELMRLEGILDTRKMLAE
jgi:hypothetical protein